MSSSFVLQHTSLQLQSLFLVIRCPVYSPPLRSLYFSVFFLPLLSLHSAMFFSTYSLRFSLGLISSLVALLISNSTRHYVSASTFSGLCNNPSSSVTIVLMVLIIIFLCTSKPYYLQFHFVLRKSPLIFSLVFQHFVLGSTWALYPNWTVVYPPVFSGHASVFPLHLASSSRLPLPHNM